MHRQWEEMIPFYVARTLSAQETAALEKHLTRCEMCRTQVEEWRAIASAVQAKAIHESHGLPPLSQRVRQEITQNNRRPIPRFVNEPRGKIIPLPRQKVQKRPSRSLVVPVTLVAAVATIFLVGGAIFYMLVAESPVDEPTNIVALSAQETQTEVTDSPLHSVTVTTEDDMGIFSTPTAFPTPYSTSVLPSASQRSPMIGLGGAAPDSGSAPERVPDDPLDMPSVSVQSMSASSLNSDVCFVWNNTSQIINIYAAPGIQYDVVEIMQIGSGLEANVRSENGWYQVIERGRGLLGWVDGGLVTADGNCQGIPEPTPTLARTPITSSNTCLAQGNTEDGIVNLYAGPGQRYDVLNTISPQTSAEVVARSDNDWYQVAYTVYGRVWDGWVRADEVRLYQQCDALPEIYSGGYEPLATPSFETPTAISPSATPVMSRGEVVHFTVMPQTVVRGRTVSLRWETQNVTSVWIEYHGTEISPMDVEFQPIRLYSDLSPTGTLNVLIPETYPYSEIRFNLILESYNRAGRQAGETVIIPIEE